MEEVLALHHDLRKDIHNVFSLLRFLKEENQIKDEDLRFMLEKNLEREKNVQTILEKLSALNRASK
jgi:hypothetical protein